MLIYNSKTWLLKVKHEVNYDKKNTEVRELLGVDAVSLLIKRSILLWFRHVEVKDDADWLKRCMKTETEGTHQRGHPRNTLWDCIKWDIGEFWPVL